MSLDGPSLVTGALGQDGFILCRRLRALGVDVVGVARPGGGHAVRRRVLEQDLGCRIVDADLTDPQPLGALVADLRPASIFHLAAAHHSSHGTVETPDTWRAMIAVNLVATEALAHAAVATGGECSLIYASSSQIWTARDPDQRINETTPVEPATFYGHTKVWAADLLGQYRDRHGLKTFVAFLFNHESPWRSSDFVTRMVAQAAAQAARGDTAPLHLRNIGARADWQAAEDVVEALILMAEAPVPDNYVLASGRSHSVRDVVEAAFGHVGIEWRHRVTADRDQAGPCLIGDPAKARRRLGWRPRVDFEQLVRGMVDADLARLGGEMVT